MSFVSSSLCFRNCQCLCLRAQLAGSLAREQLLLHRSSVCPRLWLPHRATAMIDDIAQWKSSLVALGKGMRPSWYRSTRRAGGKNMAIDDRYAFKRRSTQTEGRCRMITAMPPDADAVPLPMRLFVPKLGEVHPSVLHAENILELRPLHSEPLPLSAWRLLTASCQADHAFCHPVLPRCPDDGGVLMCVSRQEPVGSCRAVCVYSI